MRNASNSKWYIPLVAGLDAVERARPPLEYDPIDLIPPRPGPPPWQLTGMVLWWDASSLGTLHGGASISLVDDRSGTGHPGSQATAAKRPTLLSTTLLPRALNFEG